MVDGKPPFNDEYLVASGQAGRRGHGRFERIALGFRLGVLRLVTVVRLFERRG